MLNRRGFLALLGLGTAGAMTLDIDKLLWVPGKKTIFLPSTTVFGGEKLTVSWMAKEAAMLFQQKLGFLPRVVRGEAMVSNVRSPHQYHVDFASTSSMLEGGMTFDAFSARYLDPAMGALAERVTRDGGMVFGELPLPRGAGEWSRVTGGGTSVRVGKVKDYDVEMGGMVERLRIDVLVGKGA